ncbi:MAG: 4-(cytidine 5'-diphospho)-2-C-methyl-D-erythritol kinase, partial [Acidisphaera sp.]|nr:4-(cytidine 5'-diphospho)-2-C-methyl-D-erythritol kinase [Acidisphaera sp.]
MSAWLAEPARAKVNLFLHVVGRRADGYHLLDSIVAFPPFGDAVRVSSDPNGELTLSIDGPFGAALQAEPENLVLRAARALAAACGRAPCGRLELTKRLPLASGIGGGSADAAATLRALARLWGVAIPPGLAAALGADVPVCVVSRPVRMGGVGDVLSAVPPLPAGGIALANP